MMASRIRTLLLVLTLAFTAVACGGRGRDWNAQPMNSNGIEVVPIRVWVASGKLWFRTEVRNTGPAPIMVDRDAITLALPTGEVLRRSQSSFGGVHTPYMIPPGGSHAVYVEFLQGATHWRDVPQAQLNLTGAITVNGQPIAVPPLVVGQ